MKTIYLLYQKKIFLIIILLISNFYCYAQSLTATGSWTGTLPTITEAGSNYSGTYESATNQIILSTSVPLLLGNAKVSVRYEANPKWDNSLILSARRTSNGTTLCVLCTITGGTNYQPIALTDIELYRIRAVLALASYSNINIQLQLSGVSVTLPADTYQSRIVFTVSAI